MMAQYVSLLAFYLFLCFRILFRAFCNSVCPSDLVRAQKMERLSAQDYSSSLRQWRENKAAQRHIPQNLSVNADMPHLTDCIAEQGAVLSWPITVCFGHLNMVISSNSDCIFLHFNDRLIHWPVRIQSWLFSGQWECFHRDVPGLAHPLWAELAEELHRKLLPVQWWQYGLGSLVFVNKRCRELFTFHTAGPVTFLFTHALQHHTRTSRVVRMKCGSGCGYFAPTLMQYSIFGYWGYNIQFHNCIGHLKMSLLLSLTFPNSHFSDFIF